MGQLLVERALALNPGTRAPVPWLIRTAPEASMVLVQGIGRLIRSQDDRGAVVLLDNRILQPGLGSRCSATRCHRSRCPVAWRTSARCCLASRFWEPGSSAGPLLLRPTWPSEGSVMISFHRMNMLRLHDEVRDPAFTRLIEDGYRPIMALPVQEDHKSLPRGVRSPGEKTSAAPSLSPLLIALAVIQVCALVAQVVGIALR